jgi:hypothetical protein
MNAWISAAQKISAEVSIWRDAVRVGGAADIVSAPKERT